MKYKISIILPVFNVENYIKDSLESIIDQTIGFENLEVIMVDDCSTDKSGEIMDEYACKYENFKAIHLEKNSGAAGKPRNVGIERATGKYLMFLDPDDYFLEDACKILYENIDGADADIIFGKFKVVMENGKVIDASSWYEFYSTDLHEIKNVMVDNKILVYRSPPTLASKVFKRDFVEKNDIIFPEEIPGQDFTFMAHCFLKTGKINYINENIYMFRKRETKNKSISFNRNKKYINGLIQAYIHTYEICRENNKEEEFPLIMENRFPYWFKQLTNSDLTNHEKNKALKFIRPILEVYYKSGLTLPDHLMPVLESIIDKNFDDTILLLDQSKVSKDSEKSQGSDVTNLKDGITEIDKIDVSVIITTHNDQKIIKKVIFSVLKFYQQNKVELVVLDDGSTDNTINIVEKIRNKHNNIKLIKLENNNQNMSKLRNLGIKNSNGEYVTFFDYKYEINTHNLLKMVNYAQRNVLDCITCHVKEIQDGKVEYQDTFAGDNEDQIAVMKNIMVKKGNRLDIIIKKDFLSENDIRFNKDYHTSVETLFYADLFSYKPKIEYYDSYIYQKRTFNNFYHNQKYLDEDLNDQISVWELIEKKLKKIDIDYYGLRLPTEIKNTFKSVIFHLNGKISNESFNRLSMFLNKNIRYLRDCLTLPKRHELLFNSIIEGNYKTFLELSKKRLLIAGHDLKFIEPAFDYLKDDYNIKVDKWEGHNAHDEQKSKKLLNWADFIFCEWFLGNSVWYSHRKMEHQRLIIRAHKFELSQDFGNQVDYEGVNGVICISYYFLELFTKVFKIPRQKMIMLSNYVETDIYTGIKTENFKYNIAMAGYIPRWKGLMKALKILRMLKETDEKFKLHLKGKHHTELPWVWNNPKERSYYQECEDFIKENALEDSVIFDGWSGRSNMFNNIGYVLSLSDIEGSHQVVAEAPADSTLSLSLHWEGAEYVYPEAIIFENINDIKDIILSTYKNDVKYGQMIKEMNDYVVDEFDIEKIVDELKLILQKIS